jgi:predicted metal-dependent phosphotriesterase family hydrolase
MIRTVLGDIQPSEVTGAYLHEHLIIDSPIVREEMPHIYLDDVASAISEAKDCAAHSINLLVDCMPGESGRNLEKLRTISNESKVYIVSATGMHNPKYYEKSSRYLNADRERLKDIFIEELNSGCGIIKIHSLSKELSPSERELFAAAVFAQKATGAPILTHCEDGKGALSQITELVNLGANLRRTVLSHTDKQISFDYHREILTSGINVEYDQSLRQSDSETKPSLDLTIAMCNEGYSNQIMLGTDGARRSLWRSLGGSPGLAWLASGWRNLLSAELSETVLIQLFRDNPRRFLAWNNS